MSWESALSLWSLLEGAWNVVTNPIEGETAGGIVGRYYILWAARHGRDMTFPPPTEEAHSSFLYDEIWTPHHCGAFPDPCDAVAMQCVGNLPWVAGNECLQRALSVTVDGDIGPKTLAAIRLWDARELADRILTEQEAHYISVNGPELKGLLNRVSKVRDWLSTS